MAKRALPLLLISLAVPAPAAAHIRSGTLSVDFEARITGLRPANAGVSAQVLGGDQRLQLHVAPPHVVVVLGIEGEPFLRFTPAGVEANLASLTATAARVVKPSQAAAHLTWRRVAGGHTFAWHESRLRPQPSVGGGSSGPRVVATWSIPLLVDGRRSALTGTERFATGPSLVRWLGAGALLLVTAGAAACWLPRRRQQTAASALVAAAAAALLVGWFGIVLADRVSLLAILFVVVFAATALVLLLAAIAAANGAARLGVMALIGAFTATFALPELPVFGHAFVLSALPALAARAMVLTAVVGGAGAAIVAAPAVVELLDA